MFQVCFVKSWFKRDQVSTATMMATMDSTKEREGPSTTSTMGMVATAATTETKGLSTVSTVAVGATEVSTTGRKGLSLTAEGASADPVAVSAVSTRQEKVYLDKEKVYQ